jgi:flagellar biosynthesis/type III secretory pathway protein FliH
LAPPESIQQLQKSIQVTYNKIDKYTPGDWRMYNEGKDRGYTDGYNQGLLEGHDNGWDEAKEYYQKILDKALKEAIEQWNEDVATNAYSEELTEEYQESEVNDE